MVSSQKFILNSLLTVDPCDHTFEDAPSERNLFGECPFIRKQKREEVQNFLLDPDSSCVAIIGPPGCLKSASVKWAASQSNMSLAELVIDGKWSIDKMRSEMARCCGQEWLIKDVDKKVVVIHCADLEILERSPIQKLIQIANQQKL